MKGGTFSMGHLDERTGQRT